MASEDVSGGSPRFALKYGLLGRVRVAWGAGKVLGEDALLVASQDEDGGKRLAIVTPSLKLGPPNKPLQPTAEKRGA